MGGIDFMPFVNEAPAMGDKNADKKAAKKKAAAGAADAK
jgi:hypothetical protein